MSHAIIRLGIATVVAAAVKYYLKKLKKSSPSHVLAEKDRGISVVVGASGSIASVKVPDILEELIAEGIRVDLVVTEQAFFFFNIEYNGRKPIDTIQKLMKCRGENNVPMLHIYR